MTPEFRHWHDANYPESIHTNYSVLLPVWDTIWGTYRMPDDQRPERYGVDDRIVPVVTATPALRRSWWVAASVAL